MQRKYNLAYFILPIVVFLGLMTLIIGVDAQAQIAFASNRDGNFELYVMDTDGRNPKRLTNNPAIDWDPSWSPDGKRIVFSSEKGESGWDIDIYVIDADGGNLQKLTDNRLIDNYPSWSPDGERIVFSSSRGAFWWETDIYVMDADGGNPQQLTNDPEGDNSPAWSPDGERIAFVSYRDKNAEIYVMDADGKIPQNLTGKFVEQDVSPVWFRPPLGVAPAGRTLTMWGWLKQVVR